jgi:nucleotide-binding universal stress UspA family protein
LERAGFQVDQMVQAGLPANEIMKAASRSKADLIVTGAKGMGAVERFLLGSVTMKLAQHGTQSLLVVR